MEKVEKPDCYECEYYGGECPSSCHICCAHPSLKAIVDSDIGQLFKVLGKRVNIGEDETRVMNSPIKVVGNPNGIRNGWFNWPFNFDPIWLVSCTGFKKKEVKP
jgi:hypothetical protein